MFTFDALPYVIIGVVFVAVIPIYLLVKSKIAETMNPTLTFPKKVSSPIKTNKKKKSKKRQVSLKTKRISTEDPSESDISAEEQNATEEPEIDTSGVDGAQQMKSTTDKIDHGSDYSSPSQNESGRDVKKPQQSSEINEEADNKGGKSNAKRDKKKRYKAKRKQIKAAEIKEQVDQSESAQPSEDECVDARPEEAREEKEAAVLDTQEESADDKVLSILKDDRLDQDQMLKLCTALVGKLNSCGVNVADVVLPCSSSAEGEVIKKLTQDLKTMGMKLKSAVKMIEDERTNNKALTTKMATCEQKIVDLEGKNQEYMIQIHESKTTIDEKQKCIEEQSKRIEKLQGENSRFKGKDEAGSRELGIEETINVYRVQLRKLVAKSDYLERQLTMRNNEVISLKKSYDTMQSNLQKATQNFESMKEDLITKDNEISTLQMQLSRKELDLKTMLGSLKDTSAALEASKSKISELEDQLVGRNSELKILSVQAEELEGLMHEKEKQAQSISQSNAELRFALEEKQNEIALREREISALRQELAESQHKLSGYNEQNMALLEASKTNETTASVLLEEVEQCKNRIMDLEKQLEDRTRAAEESATKLRLLEESSVSQAMDAKSLIEEQRKQVEFFNQKLAAKDTELTACKSEVSALQLSLSVSTRKVEECEEEKRILKTLITENSVQLVSLQNEINKLTEQLNEKNAINDVTNSSHAFQNEDVESRDLKVLVMKYFPNLDLDTCHSLDHLDELFRQKFGEPLVAEH